jgi:hypothetical protein
MANLDLKIVSPEKMALHQPMMIPPEAPLEGTKSNVLNFLGASF